MPSHMPSVISIGDGLRHGNWPLVSPSSWYYLRIWAARMLKVSARARIGPLSSVKPTILHILSFLTITPQFESSNQTLLSCFHPLISLDFLHLESSSQGVEDFRNGYKFCAPYIYAPFQCDLIGPPSSVLASWLDLANTTWGSSNVQLSS